METWEPVPQSERYLWLDALRGAALFGVLTVNLLTLFRVSLFHHILNFHTHPGWANTLTDVSVAALLEFKAFDLFSFCYGIGLALQAERAATHRVNPTRFLRRRLLILLTLGLLHLLAIWNGDILTLYAVCGFLLLPLLRLPTRFLAISGAAAMLLAMAAPFGAWFPSEGAMRIHAANATRIYATGGFSTIFTFRLHETRHFIAPFLLATLPKALAIMLLGAATWRSGVVRHPDAHRRLLRAIVTAAGLLGVAITIVSVYAKSSRHDNPIPQLLQQLGSDLPLAAAYAAALLLWVTARPRPPLALPLAAAGQMALTNYFTQSILLSFLFYGYGLGLFGKMGSAAGLLLAAVIYICQIAASQAWLRRYRFGPLEWLWRSLTYGERQQFRRSSLDEVN